MENDIFGGFSAVAQEISDRAASAPEPDVADDVDDGAEVDAGIPPDRPAPFRPERRCHTR